MTATALATRLPDDDISGAFVARQLRIGLEYYAAGRIEAAMSAYRRGLAAADDEPSGSLALQTLSELHANLANACMVKGDFADAAANYRSALQLAPHLVCCWCNLGNAHLQTGKAQDSIALYLQALKLNPGHWPSRTNLVQALMTTRQYLMARALLLELAHERPHDAQIQHQLGKACFELNEMEDALRHFRQAVALNPRDADSLYWIGGIRQRGGDIAAAEAAYAQAAQIQPLIRRPAAKYRADFRVLALYAPFAGNTPTELLFKEAAYDTDTLALFGDGDHDAEALRQDVRRRRQSDFRCRPGRSRVAAGRRSGPPARQARRSTIPARFSGPRAMRWRICCRGFRIAAFRKSCARRRVPIFPATLQAATAACILRSGPAGGDAWRR